jgi:hypothetical protein
MNDPNGPYSKKDVEHLTRKDRANLKKQAQHYLETSNELLKIIMAQPKLRKMVVKNKKVRDAVKKELHPTYSQLTAKK